MRETWYILEDNSVADPHDVAPDKNGVLRHKNGKAVAMRGETPRSRSVDVEEERAKAPAKKTTDMEPEPEPATARKASYKTRKGV